MCVVSRVLLETRAFLTLEETYAAALDSAQHHSRQSGTSLYRLPNRRTALRSGNCSGTAEIGGISPVVSGTGTGAGQPDAALPADGRDLVSPYAAENRMGTTGEEQREFLEQESQELTKLEQLLNELVNLSRLETHMIQIHSLHESLKKTLTEAVSQIYMKARGKDISIQVEMDDDIVVNHDSKWTVEALTNILENAVKYSPEHTTITVRTQELASNVLIEVEDEGMGIPAEELHKIYQRFYRGRKAKEQVKDGAGVGLYLARKIIEEQGGTIAAKRKAEKGMIFKVTLPLIIGE